LKETEEERDACSENEDDYQFNHTFQAEITLIWFFKERQDESCTNSYKEK
jgi:hypothetical protein